MKTICYKFILLLAMICFANTYLSAQTDEATYCDLNRKNFTYGDFPSSPATPLTTGWVLDPTSSDEFDGNSIDLTKWEIYNKFVHSDRVHTADMSYNVAVDSGCLVLTMKKETDTLWCQIWDSGDRFPYVYSSGRVRTKEPVHYGYCEVLCYLPNSERQRPCYWFWGNERPYAGASEKQYDEIDVFERITSNPQNILQQNVYRDLKKPTQSRVGSNITFNQAPNGIWATFAVEWLPKEISFYINGKMTSRIIHTDAEHLITDNSVYTCANIDYAIPQKIELSYTLLVAGGIDPIPDRINEKFKIAHVRTYKLKKGYSGQYWPTTFNVNDQHIFKVNNKLKLGGAGHTALINASNITLWAEKEMVFDTGFEVPAGKTFTARVITTHPDLFYNQSPIIIIGERESAGAAIK